MTRHIAPIRTNPIVVTTVAASPIRSNPGWLTNTSGSTKATMPTRQATNATAIGLARAIDAAANAATATGGVIADIDAK